MDHAAKPESACGQQKVIAYPHGPEGEGQSARRDLVQRVAGGDAKPGGLVKPKSHCHQDCACEQNGGADRDGAVCKVQQGQSVQKAVAEQSGQKDA